MAGIGTAVDGDVMIQGLIRMECLAQLYSQEPHCSMILPILRDVKRWLVTDALLVVPTNEEVAEIRESCRREFEKH